VKFDLRQPILDFQGRPLVELEAIRPGQKLQPGQTLKTEVINFRAVLHAAIYRKDETTKPNPEEVERIGLLGLKIWKRWEVDLDHKECDFILEKAKVSFALDPLYYIRLKEFLSGQEPDVPDEETKETVV